MLCLLHEHPIALLAPTNNPRMKWEKTQIKNLFESIQDEDVTYSIVFENITAEEKGYVQSVCIAFFNVFLYILYNIQFGVSEKAWSNTFLLIQKQSPDVFWEKRCP